MTQEKDNRDDPQFVLELGPNLVMEFRGNSLITPPDQKMKWDKDGKPASGEVTDKYWFIKRNDEGVVIIIIIDI